MSWKESLGALARRTGRLPVIGEVIHHPAVRGVIEKWPGMGVFYSKGWFLVHPFDRENNIDTSGFVPPEQLPTLSYQPNTHIYAGSQPSIIRTALGKLPPPENFTFVDLGCGKGRPLLVASEIPYRAIIGVELSPELAEQGRKNAAIVAQAHPSRRAVQVKTGDAGAFQLPAGNLVIFLYNPFGEAVMKRVVANIEAALAAGERSIYVVYYNPVYGACMDQSPRLSRYYAAMLPYARSERGYGPDLTDTVVIWQGGGTAAPLPGANRGIQVTIPGTRAELIP